MGKSPSRERPAARFVLDCSVTMAWYFSDKAHAYANSVRKSLALAEAVVPVIWPLDVANVLVMGERRKRSTKADAGKWLGFLRRLPIHVDQEGPVRAWSDILEVARAHALSAYDAAYIELALRLGLPMASLDDTLKEAAASAGVPEYQA